MQAAKPFTVKDRVEFMYRGAKTRRYHTEDVLHAQNVGEHSWGVALLVVLIMPTVRKEVILAALAHDLAEHVVGDVPAPSKRASPELKSALDRLETDLLNKAGLAWGEGLSIIEERILKAADIIDGMMYCVNERKRGNADIARVYTNFHSYALQIVDGLPEGGVELVTEVNNLWKEVHHESQR